MPPSRLKGVLSPVVTPFHYDLSADPERFVRHCKWLLAHGCSGLAVFGTNSEANSLAAEERIALLEALVGGGVPAEKLLAGTGCCALPDSVKLTAHAVKLGCAGVLMNTAVAAARDPVRMAGARQSAREREPWRASSAAQPLTVPGTVTGRGPVRGMVRRPRRCASAKVKA